MVTYAITNLPDMMEQYKAAAMGQAGMMAPPKEGENDGEVNDEGNSDAKPDRDGKPDRPKKLR